MKKENITKISFNLYNGSRSEFAEFETDKPVASFSFGDYFGSDGKIIWLQMDNRRDEFEEELEEEPDKEELLTLLEEILEDF